MWKRIVAAIIDFFLIVLPLFILCIMVINQVSGENVNAQVVPIVALLRNALKVLSRYLFGIPLIFALFSKKCCALHDVLIHNSVVKCK